MSVHICNCFQASRANSGKITTSSQFVLEMCAAAKIAKNSLKPFVGSRSFKVIGVNKSKKPVASACYNKQPVCTYLQSFSRYRSCFVARVLELREPGLGLLKSTLNAENFTLQVV